MPEKIAPPARITAAGEPPKLIDEYIGRARTGTEQVSIAHMRSPAGWQEPAQRPEFTEYTLVLKGTLRVEHDEGVMEVTAGEAVITTPGERVRYSSPEEGGAEYVAICVPAFSAETVHRE
jgi:quercetin dioxygenase-like cupin family protein